MPFSEKKSHEFTEAARHGNLELVKQLSLDPEVDVNWKPDGSTETAFNNACWHDHPEVVRFLLDFKEREIYYNQKFFQWTAFMFACRDGYKRVIELLLDDERIDIDHTSRSGEFGLWLACYAGHIDTVKLLLASRRNIDTKKMNSHFNLRPAEIAESRFHFGIASLLCVYERDPEGTRMQLRVELGYTERDAAELFATIVYLSDDYLQLKKE
jgi:ankyrin repeat protein